MTPESRFPDLSAAARALVASRLGAEADAIELEPLRGGLIAPAVLRVTARYPRRGRRTSWRFVAKRLPPGQHRELVVHRHLAARLGDRLAPELLGHATLADGATVLFLEWVRPDRRWPWTDHENTRRATEHLARLHRALDGAERPDALHAWDYQGELAESAATTLEAFDQLPRGPEWRLLRRVRTAVERVAEELPEMRRQLLAEGRGWIHGDVHPGNVLLSRHRGEASTTFLDWARLRVGSPLEDLASWLLSLAHWEPAARRGHDRLALAYLRAAGLPEALGPTFRDAYWLAAASNALAGALRYQILAAVHASGRAERDKALGAARGWARSIRRADARWRGPVAVGVAAGSGAAPDELEGRPG